MTPDKAETDDSELIHGEQPWVKRHSVLTFFALTFLISWVTWFLIPFVSNGDLSLQSLVDLTGAFGPAISAILVSSLMDSEPSGASGIKRLVTFSVIFATTLIMQLYAYVFLYGIKDLLRIEKDPPISVEPAINYPAASFDEI